MWCLVPFHCHDRTWHLDAASGTLLAKVGNPGKRWMVTDLLLLDHFEVDLLVYPTVRRLDPEALEVASVTVGSSQFLWFRSK